MFSSEPRKRYAELLTGIRQVNDKNALKLIEKYDNQLVNNSIKHAKWAYDRALTLNLSSYKQVSSWPIKHLFKRLWSWIMDKSNE